MIMILNKRFISYSAPVKIAREEMIFEFAMMSSTGTSSLILKYQFTEMQILVPSFESLKQATLKS